MRLAMVIGEQRMALEQRMLNRLAVGLIAEGVGVVRIVPEGLPAMVTGEGERRMALAPRFEARMKSMRWVRSAQVRSMVDALAGGMPDALYLVGRDAWSFGLDLAKALDRPAILEAWSASQALALPRPTIHSRMAAVTAPCEGIARIARDRVGPDLTAVVPMGVALSNRFTKVLSDREQPPCAAVLGGARDVATYSAMLNGLARALKSFPALEVFIELRGPHEHDIWRIAERAGLINAVSAIGSASQHHALLTRCDLILWPERYGELRSVLLESMAMAIPVVAAADATLDMLIDGVTARIVAEPTATGWGDAITGILDVPAQAQALGLSGRERVLAQHRSSEQVRGMATLLQRVGGKARFAFTGDSQ